MSTTDTSTDTFPIETRKFHLTNYIEFMMVESLHQAGVNQFEIIRSPIAEVRIRNVVAKYKIYPSTYAIYRVTEQKTDRFKITPVEFTENLLRNTIYLLINNSITAERSKLEIRTFDMYRARAINMRFPLVMPSRGKTFR